MGGTVERRPQAGVSMIEVMMAVMVLTVALMAIAMTMAQGLHAVLFAQEQLIAKERAREALESVFTARSTQNVLFDEIRNSDAGGIFVAGYQEIRGMGTDGIANTEDDAEEALESIVLPGPDGLLGTDDDEVRELANYRRRIRIENVLLPNNNVDPDIRRITVEVQFELHGRWRTVSISSYISRFA